MNFRKFEIFLFVLFLSLCGLGWLASHHSINNQFEKLLLEEEQKFRGFKLERIKKSMENELLRRLSYYFYVGEMDEFSSYLKTRYQAKRVNVTRNQSKKNNSVHSLGWRWHGLGQGSYLEGLSCNQDICLDIKIPWSRAWLIDGTTSLVNQLSGMQPIAWTTVLESSELDIPKVVTEYVTMTDRLEGLKIGSQIFYGSKFGPPEVNLHRLTVVNTDNLREKVFEYFIKLFWLIFCVVVSTYSISYFWNYQWSSTYRILMAISSVILLLGAILGLQSKTLIREQEKQIRHQREMEVVNSRALTVVKPSFIKVRHFLPFQDGGIYSIQNGSDLLLFIASSGELRGKYYSDRQGHRTKELLTLILLFCLSVVTYIRLFRDSNKFWRQLSERLEKQITSTESCQGIEEFTDNIVYDYWDIWRLQLDTEKQIQRRALQQRLINFESDSLLKHVGISDKTSYPKDLNCVVVCVAPSESINLEKQSAKDYFDDMNKFLEIFRVTLVKYGGVPIVDNHWHQRAFFALPKSFLSCQRALLFGLDFIKQLKELDLPSGVSYRVIVKQGYLDFTKISNGSKNEVMIKGSILQECDDAMEHLDNLYGFWIHCDLVTESLRSSFDISSNKFNKWCEVIGVRNVEDHLGLLDFPSSELQKTALELLSFKSHDLVLDKILEKLPYLEIEVQEQAVAIMHDYLHIIDGRSKIFNHLIGWAEKGYDEIVFKVLVEFQKQSVHLNKHEINMLLKLRKQTHEELVFSLALENSDFKNLEEFELRVKCLSNFNQSRWILRRFKEKPSSEHLDQLSDFLKETDAKFLAYVLEIWCELNVEEKNHEGSCFRQWFEHEKENFLIRILELVMSDNVSVKLKSLRVIANLKISDAESQLVRIYLSSRDPEFKAEIIFTLQNLGSSAFLLQNLN